MELIIDFEKTITEAKEKLEREKKSANFGRYERVMADDVLKALIGFIEQDFEFAEAVAQNSQTFGDCMTAVAKNCGSALSDFEAFKRAVQFYFPGAEIEYQMKIRVNPFDVEQKEKTGVTETKIFSLLDILGE